MNHIRAIYPQENVLIAEAGVILADIQQAAANAGRLFPLSLAAEGTCQIGGNLATNAGGINVLRYGNARDLCLGLEVVLPDGSIWHGLKRLRKDNTGYDLRNLMIGAEGTLGVITAAALRLFAPPAHGATGVFSIASPEAAIELLSIVQEIAGNTLSAFELVDATSQHLVAETMPSVRLPFESIPPWSTVIELGTSAQVSPEELFGTIFEAAHDAGLVDDGVISQSEGQARSLWKMRESIPEANRLAGAFAFHDISLPPSDIPAFLRRSEAVLASLGDLRIGTFGHLGDGNLHYNIVPARGRKRADYTVLAPRIIETVHDLVNEMGGSFSAEHGIGRMKVNALEHYGDPAHLIAMRCIKSALDPQNIMNPGAVLRDRSA